MTYVESLNRAIQDILSCDTKAILIGEDLADPYGGAFKVTKGASTLYPDQVFSSPISEAGIMGLAVGAAIKGMSPIVEVMFGDFITLMTDQIVNHAVKMPWLLGEPDLFNITIRAPMGGGRGYGATHSQSLEKLFMGVPFLDMVSTNAFIAPGKLLKAAHASKSVVLFIEHKLLYPKPLLVSDSPECQFLSIEYSGDRFPTTTVSVQETDVASITVVSYGQMASQCLAAMNQLLMDYEIDIQLVIPTCIKPVDMAPILKSIKKTGRLLVVEEGTEGFNWANEIIYLALQSDVTFRSPPKRLCSLASPIASAPTLENAILPTESKIVSEVLGIIQKTSVESERDNA